MREEVEAHLRDESRQAQTEATQDAIQQQKSKLAPKKRPEKVDFFTQVRAALIRDYQMRWGDQWTFWARQATTFIQAFITGSLFYAIPASTGGLFLRGGTIFLTLLCKPIITFMMYTNPQSRL
jgi:ATP-binding cassette subfamily G (WHITE) protein 2 (SNQ2)